MWLMKSYLDKAASSLVDRKEYNVVKGPSLKGIHHFLVPDEGSASKLFEAHKSSPWVE